MSMEQWASKLDAFLAFNDHKVLQHAGKISHDVAKQLVETEYQKFVEKRRIENDALDSDFDRLVETSQQLKSIKKDS